MNILVLGGTGAIGMHLVEILVARGNVITVTSRRYRPNTASVCYVLGNAKDQLFMRNLLAKQWDVIVDFMVYSTAEFAECVESLLGATNHYLYLSSSRVYSDSRGPITEDTPRLLDVCTDTKYLNTDEYALEKARQENILFRSVKKNWTIIRPYITYSSNRLQLGVLEKEAWLYRTLQGRTIVFSADMMEKTTTLTYGADVARGIVSLVGKESALGEAFHITASQSVTWSKVLNTYLDVLEPHMGARPKVSLQELPLFSKWCKSKYQIIYDRLYCRRFNNEKISQFCDANVFTVPQLGLQQNLEQFLQSVPPQFNEINWRAEAIKDLLLKEHTPLTEIITAKNKLKYLMFRHSVLR